MDELLGGAGNSRGRSRQFGMRAGDVIDFWRVERAEAPRTILLHAEMILPGAAWLQFELRVAGSAQTLLRCCAWFQPKGLLGEMYWYLLYPIHLLIFRKLTSAVSQRAESTDVVAPEDAVA